MRVSALGLLVLLCAASAAGSAPAQPGPPRLLGLRISNGGTPFAGDTPSLTTISPNRDGFRDRALIRFKLDRAGTVEVKVVATDEVRRPVRTIWSTRRKLTAGPHTIVWQPARTTPDRTYLVRLAVQGRKGGRRVYGYEPPRRDRLTSGLVVRVQGIQAGFLNRSYPVGGDASLTIATDARRIRLQLFSFANLPHPTVRDLRTSGLAVAPAVRLDWRRRRNAARVVQISHAGDSRERALLPAGNGRRRAGRLRAADPAAAHARRAQGRGRPLDEHLAGLQLPRPQRRRLGRQLVRQRGNPRGRPAPPLPRLRRPLPLPGLGPELHLVAEADGQAGRLPLGRRSPAGGQRRRAAERVRPRRLPRPRGVREPARLRRRPALPRSRRAADVPVREQLLLEGRARRAAASARDDVAQARPARGGAGGLPVVGRQLRHRAGALCGAGSRRPALGVRGHRPAQRLHVRPLRDRDRRAHRELAARERSRWRESRT